MTQRCLPCVTLLSLPVHVRPTVPRPAVVPRQRGVHPAVQHLPVRRLLDGPELRPARGLWAQRPVRRRRVRVQQLLRGRGLHAGHVLRQRRVRPADRTLLLHRRTLGMFGVGLCRGPTVGVMSMRLCRGRSYHVVSRRVVSCRFVWSRGWGCRCWPLALSLSHRLYR